MSVAWTTVTVFPHLHDAYFARIRLEAAGIVTEIPDQESEKLIEVRVDEADLVEARKVLGLLPETNDLLN